MSDESDEDYAEFGTPLEPLDEEACPRKKPFTIEEQFARDKQGRRRFHGAFTGGFSAGFLNTVGSLEGWKPSSFKSSKSEKGPSLVQRPEQFMDDEDLGEFGIAPSVLHAKDDFSNNAVNKRKYTEKIQSSLFGGTMLKSLLQPVRETIGIKLLKKMGWKPGQGTGPRLSIKERKKVLKLRRKTYGCSLPGNKSDGDTNSEDDDDDDEQLRNITFAPEDYPYQLVTPKENYFGIGYKGLDKRSVLSVPLPNPEFKLRNKKTISGQAFGVGAFEDEDEDIYSREDMSQYDFSLNDNPKDGTLASGYITGEDLYDAFILATTRVMKKVFSLPDLPKDYKPGRKIKVTRFEPIVGSPESQKLETSPDRLDLITQAEKIQNEARKLTKSMNSTEDSTGVFKPFWSNTDKQARYEKYLELLKDGKQDDLCNLQPITMTEWEREREKAEFQQASKIFKPLTEIIEDRFTFGSQPDDVNDPLAMVESFKSGSEDEINAAKMNMYGRLTRTVEDWKPSSVLCKRFNIPELNKDEIPVVKNKPKYSIFDDMWAKPKMEKEIEKKEVNIVKVTSEETIKKTEKAEETEPVEISQSKNKVDLFNEIFLDSESEDEELLASSESNLLEKRGMSRPDFETAYEENIINEKRNTSPPKGIFENLDYNFLLTNNSVLETSSKEPAENKSKIQVLGDSEDGNGDISLDLVYGPKLPGSFTISEAPVKKVSLVEPPVSLGDWVEKTDHKKHKKDKKSKKSKHKHKHKKHKTRKK